MTSYGFCFGNIVLSGREFRALFVQVDGHNDALGLITCVCHNMTSKMDSSLLVLLWEHPGFVGPSSTSNSCCHSICYLAQCDVSVPTDQNPSALVVYLHGFSPASFNFLRCLNLLFFSCHFDRFVYNYLFCCDTLCLAAILMPHTVRAYIQWIACHAWEVLLNTV